MRREINVNINFLFIDAVNGTATATHRCVQGAVIIKFVLNYSYFGVLIKNASFEIVF